MPPRISLNPFRIVPPRSLISCFPPAYRTRRPYAQYNRFSRVQSLTLLWRRSSMFRYSVATVGAGGIMFIVFNIETVPVSGRMRFNWVSPEGELALTQGVYQQTLDQYRNQILGDRHPYTKMVHRVLTRLIPASGFSGQEWEVHVIDDNSQLNAFVLPGGKVFVFSGLIPICQNDDGLAAVLGHEIAHNVAHHAAENFSRMSFLTLIALMGSLVFDVSGSLSLTILEYAYNRPRSRVQESEADYIGLMVMSQSCYNPTEAVRLWQRMERAEKIKIPQFLSTHPSNNNRIEKLQKWLPEAEQKRIEGQCGIISDYADPFQKAIGGFEKDFW